MRAKQLLAAGWLVKFVVGGKVFKQEIGSEGRGCYMGKESRPAGHQSRFTIWPVFQFTCCNRDHITSRLSAILYGERSRSIFIKFNY